MAIEVRNVSVDPVTMPVPFQGVLAGGQAIVLNYPMAGVLEICPSLGSGFRLVDLGSGYAGSNDDAAYGLLASPSLAGPLDADNNNISNVATLSVTTVRGRASLNLLLAPDSAGGAVRIVKANGSTIGFESNATGTAVNGATPVARATHIANLPAFTDPPSAAEMTALRTRFNALLTVVENFGLVATA